MVFAAKALSLTASAINKLSITNKTDSQHGRTLYRKVIIRDNMNLKSCLFSYIKCLEYCAFRLK